MSLSLFRRFRPGRVVAAALCAVLLPAGAAWAAPTPAPSAAAALPTPYARWQSSMDAFAAADKAAQPQAGGVLFVGSSTIRLWTDLREDFRQLPVVINRGFGGSTMADCQYFVKNLVLQYRPRHVMVYAGDNDLAEGRTPEQVLESFQSFVRSVREALPETRISYISIKPSPLRLSLLPRMREANDLLAQYVRTVPNSDFIDIFNPMLDAQGLPRTELFGADHLHMNDAGYDLWRTIIGSYVGEGGVPASGATAAQPRTDGLIRASARP
ncbi:SGNH/GDSL hydrolase family protein [Paracidovorax cattleyae]|uniref:Lysophospholipase L1 n=1 Tax=Paracidovorax cattleyae TaxID=80868 RepID=A0A1H0NNZ9_9BURK|nr:SGNH/GDSL hydrolase family protein [Paracidovorax cattleyae]AVS75041.1 GDSL family lipase [Paracidovorax cattleyae]MBF9265204.1 GDSL family lipase [Paracidovorax cattleyae]SDO94306.1 Lysophospholipase L1 [Paracidovorax cattleyae]